MTLACAAAKAGVFELKPRDRHRPLCGDTWASEIAGSDLRANSTTGEQTSGNRAPAKREEGQ